MIIPCSIGGITVEAHVNPIMEVNIMPWHLVYTLLGDVTLRPSDTLLKSCPFGHILECRGVTSAMPLTLYKIKVHLDFHIFDILDFDLLVGYPLKYDSEETLHLCEDEQSSSPSIEFDPLPTGPEYVVLDHD